MNVFVLNTKEDILKNEGNRVFFSYYWSQWCPKTAWLQTFFKISSFVFRTNTFIQVWIYLRESKWWQNFHFWVYCPFKQLSCAECFSGVHVKREPRAVTSDPLQVCVLHLTGSCNDFPLPSLLFMSVSGIMCVCWTWHVPLMCVALECVSHIWHWIFTANQIETLKFFTKGGLNYLVIGVQNNVYCIVTRDGTITGLMIIHDKITHG